MIPIFPQGTVGYLKDSVFEIPEVYRMNLPNRLEGKGVTVIGQMSYTVLVKFDEPHGVTLFGQSGFLFVRVTDIDAEFNKRLAQKPSQYDQVLIGNLILLGWKERDIKRFYPYSKDFLAEGIKPLLKHKELGLLMRRIYYGESEILEPLVQEMVERRENGKKSPDKVRSWTNRKWSIGHGNRTMWIQGKKIRF